MTKLLWLLALGLSSVGFGRALEAQNSVVEKAAVLQDEKGNNTLIATIFQGSNPCVARGARVYFDIEAKGRTTIYAPKIKRSQDSFSRACTREYRPVYKIVKMPVKGRLNTSFIKDFVEPIKLQNLKDLQVILWQKNVGGYCRGACPAKTIVMTTRGDLFMLKGDKIDEMDKVGQLAPLPASRIKKSISLLDEKASYKTGEMVVCNDRPGVESYALQKKKIIPLERVDSCYQMTLHSQGVEKLTRLLSALRAI